MAKAVYNTEDIMLQDETPVTLVPLPIGRLRKFMKAWTEFENMKDPEDAFDIYINCCGIALDKDFKGKFDKTLDAEKYVSDEYREYLEEVLDMDTIFKILEICGGLDIKKLMEEAERNPAITEAGPNLTSLR